MPVSSGIMEKWSDGMLVFVHYSNIPLFHYSQFAVKNNYCVTSVNNDAGIFGYN